MSRSRSPGVSGTGVSSVCTAAAAAAAAGDENVPLNKNLQQPNHQRPKPRSNTNDEAVEEQEDGAAALDLAGTVDCLLRASLVSTANSASAADPLFHSSSSLVLPSALGSNSRRRSIAAAHRMFQHNDVVAHDDEIRSGAFDSLVWRLGFSVGLLAASASITAYEQGNNDEAWPELSQIVSTLSQVCRCSHSYRLATFNSAGRSQLFPLLFRVMHSGHDVLVSGSASPGAAKNAAEAMIAVLSIFRSYCKVADIRPRLLKPPIADQLLSCLTRVLRLCARHSSNHINHSIRSKMEKDTLGLLKDLTHRLSDNEARLLVVDKPAVLELALESGVLENCNSSHRRARHRRRQDEYLATLMWNCASQRSVRAELMLLGKDNECSANVSSVLRFLSSALSFAGDNNGDDDGDDDFELEKAALSCLGNLARGAQDSLESTAGGTILNCDERNDPCVSTILAHDRGSFVEKLLAIAVDAPASSSLVCRRRAVRTIRCLVKAADGNESDSHYRPVILGIASQRGISLLSRLSAMMMNDRDQAVQIHAAESVATLYRMLSMRWNFEEDQTIEMLNNSFISVIIGTAKNKRRTEIACRSLCLSSASGEIDLRKQPDFFPSLLGLLCMQSYDHTASPGDEIHSLRFSSLKLMRMLSRFGANRPIMLNATEKGCIRSDDDGPICLLRCLAAILKPSGVDVGDDGGIGVIARAELQKEVAGILVELARDDSAQSVVECPDLLTNFTHYCTNTVGPNDPECNEAKKALIRLVAKL